MKTSPSVVCIAGCLAAQGSKCARSLGALVSKMALLALFGMFLLAVHPAFADVAVQFTPNTGNPPLMSGIYNISGATSGTAAVTGTLAGADLDVALSGTVTVSLVGGTTSATNTLTHMWADRGALTTGSGSTLTEGPLYESFSGYVLSGTTTYEWLTVSGLKPSTLYQLELYAYDNSYNGNMTFTDTTTGSLSGATTVNYTAGYTFSTDTDADAKFSGQMAVKSDTNGNIVVKGTGTNNGSAAAILNGFRISPQPWMKIKNNGTGNYLVQSGTKVVYEQYPGWNDQAAQWALLPTGSTGKYRIQNRSTGLYMNNQNQLAWVECTAGSLSWSSEKWNLIARSGYTYSIQNVWQSTQYINETGTTGYAQCSVVSGTESKSLWSLETVRGASVPWITYEAENGTTNGTVIGPGVTEGTLQAECSNRMGVTLSSTGQYVQWVNKALANAVVVRLSIPDAVGGGGTDSTLNLYVSGTFVQAIPVTSKYSWVYGNYLNNTWSNDPTAGTARRMFDEASVLLSSTIPAGVTVALQKDAANTAASYTIDFIELEQVPAALTMPANYYSITSYGAVADGTTDCATAIQNTVTAARTAGKGVWIPQGNFYVSNGFYLYNIKMNGAGMWYSKLTYSGTATSAFNIGTNAQFSDFAMSGQSTNRGNGGTCLVGTYGTSTVLQNLWIDHFGFGMWVGNVNSPANGVVINNCRVRDLYGDGINLNTGARNCTLKNTTLRNTGDDSIALFSAPYTSGSVAGSADYNNTITNCTVQSPWFANGIAVYGGSNNVIKNCEAYDTLSDFGLFLDQGFSSYAFGPTTTAQNINLYRCGGTFTYWSLQSGAIGIDSNTGSFNAPINVWDIDVYNASYAGIQVQCENGWSQAGVDLDGINIMGAGTYGINVKSGALGSGTFGGVMIYNPTSGALLQSSTNYTIIKTGTNNW